MANGPTLTAAAGLRRIQIWVLDENGYPDGDQSGATAYDGTNVDGARSYTFNSPEPRRIVHVGNDRVRATDYLPPIEGATGEISTAFENLALDAELTDTLTNQIAETTVGGLLTDKQGSEVDVCVVVWRQALNLTPGAQQSRRWQMKMHPIARLVPRGAAAGQDAADENSYTLVPGIATKYPWGTAFSSAVGEEGFTEAQQLRFASENPAMMNAWDGNNTLTEFTLSHTPISVAKTHVTVAGVAATVASVTIATKKVTMQSAPADASRVVAWYETSDAIG